jgi:acetate kinase
VIAGAGEVSVVAHRVVHGGEKFTEGTLITDDVLAQIEALSPLAPLHNPVNVAGIREMRRLFPAVPHIAVFDTAFHHTLPAYAYLYGLPYEQYEQHGVRRYGFHGTSHNYVSLRAAQFLKRRPNELRLVSCHLGNGSSLCAVDHGRSVDTSMGFTPAEGLIMGTRCGDIDAGVLAFLERTQQLTATQSEEMLNRQSGLLGLSGVSSDMREVLKAADAGQSRALLASSHSDGWEYGALRRRRDGGLTPCFHRWHPPGQRGGEAWRCRDSNGLRLDGETVTPGFDEVCDLDRRLGARSSSSRRGG